MQLFIGSSLVDWIQLFLKIELKFSAILYFVFLLCLTKSITVIII